jgi:hypothetical protein
MGFFFAMDLTGRGGCGLHWTGLGCVVSAGSCEHGIKLPVSIKGSVLEQLAVDEQELCTYRRYVTSCKTAANETWHESAIHILIIYEHTESKRNYLLVGTMHFLLSRQLRKPVTNWRWLSCVTLQQPRRQTPYLIQWVPQTSYFTNCHC